MSRPNGKCKACQHPERTRIELLVADGASQRSVARKYDLSWRTLNRHWLGHVTEERRSTLVLGPVSKAALAARVAEESESVLDHHKSVRAGLYAVYDTAVTAGDRSGVALLAGRLIEVNNAIAKLTGQLLTSPLITNTTINNTLVTSPEYLRLREGLLQLGRAHPQIRPDLIALLKRLDTEPPIPPKAPAPLLIEHGESSDA
jgi:hypothetical protein